MNDTSTMRPPSTDSQDTAGHGRHRGPVSVHDGDSAPHGRHRKPAENRTEDRAERAV
ncbi:hypothetical protein [Streptomyces hilarionis]|uniref:hypothetical protein n=1 Tax=Streptomyces hilarionis TaxID=2839954 RepID=UPI00211AA31A|nr:hypothetical protein [Streptomyces hilarionis]MCQ9134646.1 hypothetical protein [Streptomyces hilarionis]